MRAPTIDGIRQAVEARDAASLKALYDANAVLTVVDSQHPPSKPLTIQGAREIGTFLDDIYSREMTHKVEDCVIDARHVAFTEGCTYPDGTHVLASSMAELGPNGIVKQTIVQAWDG